LLVAASSRGLLVYGFGNDRRPELLGTFASPRGAQHVAAAEDYAVLTDAGPDLRVIDLSEPKAPSLLAEIRVHRSALLGRIDLVGSLAYVAADLIGIAVVDLAEPTDPQALRPGDRKMKVTFPELELDKPWSDEKASPRRED
jgi:hypothetical protein